MKRIRSLSWLREVFDMQTKKYGPSPAWRKGWHKFIARKKAQKPYAWRSWHYVTPTDFFISYGNLHPVRGTYVTKNCIHFRNMLKGTAGWDTDRNRFFVESDKHRYRSLQKPFIRYRWEANHGYGPEHRFPKRPA